MTRLPPLSDIRILSLEHAIAAPLCTRQLADLGATVIKIERRESGDFARAYDQRVKGQSSHFVWTNRGKQSLTLDLKHPGARAVLERLLAHTDVMVQNLAPGTTARLGLDFTTLAATHKRLIVCDISGYGNAGPFRERKAYDLLVQSESGFLSVTGTTDQMAKAGISIADIAAGTQACNAILAALLQRGKTGKGSHIEISMLESMVEWMGYPLYYAYEGNTAPPRSGTDHASIYPYGAFATGDSRQIMLGLQNEREWQQFCHAVLQQPQLADDPRFVSNIQRNANRSALQQIIEAVFASLSVQQLTERLEQAQIAWAGINDMAAVWNHPQLQAAGRFRQIDTPAGPVKALLPPGNNNTYDACLGEVPELGQHTREILSSLGFSEEEIGQLIADQVV